MPFDTPTKTRMFICSGRLCCLCLKQCGTNIEAAHIMDESKGGANDEANGIPVCFDCHQEIGAYDSKHPKGNKFTPDELTARRDRIYKLVDSGAIYAQIVASQARRSAPAGSQIILPEISPQVEPSSKAKRFAEMLLKNGEHVEAPGRKLKILAIADRAHVLDLLIQSSEHKDTALQVLASLLGSKSVDDTERQLVLDEVISRITLFAGLDRKIEFLRCFDQDTLIVAPEALRTALFDDLIQTVKHDQYDEVNKLVPVLIRHFLDVPPKLYADFVVALLDQSRSDSFKGAPAARHALQQLPSIMVKQALEKINSEYLWWHGNKATVRDFVKRYKNLATGETISLLDDFLSMRQSEFSVKYYPFKE